MPDKLSQLGKSLKQTQENTETALDRDFPLMIPIEHGRDIFDVVEPFVLNFETTENMSRIFLDLIFSKPPDLCCAGNICGTCETYTTYGPYRTKYTVIPESVRIMIMSPTDGEDFLLSVLNGDEWNVTNGNTITVSSAGGSPTYPLKICYAYQVTPMYMFDNFNRVLTGNELNNQLSFSETPTLLWYASGAEWSMDGQHLVLDTDDPNSSGGNTLISPHPDQFNIPTKPWDNDQWDMEIRFKVESPDIADNGKSLYFQFETAAPGGPAELYSIIASNTYDVDGFPTGYISSVVYDGNSFLYSTFAPVYIENNTYYKVRIKKDSTNRGFMKLWKDTESEPNWQIIRAGIDVNPDRIRIAGTDFTTTNWKWSFDYIKFYESKKELWNVYIDDYENRTVGTTNNSSLLQPSSSGAAMDTFVTTGSYGGVEVKEGTLRFHFRPYYIDYVDAQILYDLADIFTVGDIPTGKWTMRFKINTPTSVGQNIYFSWLVYTDYNGDEWRMDWDGVVNGGLASATGPVTIRSNTTQIISNVTFNVGSWYYVQVDVRPTTVRFGWGGDLNNLTYYSVAPDNTPPWTIQTYLGDTFTNAVELFIGSNDNLVGVDGNQSVDFSVEVDYIRFEEVVYT